MQQLPLATLWKDKNITLNTKKRLLQTLVFPITSYGSECWVPKGPFILHAFFEIKLRSKMSRCASEVDLNFMTDSSTRFFVGGSCCKTLTCSYFKLWSWAASRYFIADCLLLLRLIFVSDMFSAMFDDDFIMLIGALFLCNSYNCRKTRTYTRVYFDAVIRIRSFCS